MEGVPIGHINCGYLIIYRLALGFFAWSLMLAVAKAIINKDVKSEVWMPLLGAFMGILTQLIAIFVAPFVIPYG